MHVVLNTFAPLSCFFDLPNMGNLQVFRMYNPSDEVQLVKALSAQDCWKEGRFLKRPLVVTLCYSEVVIITKETNGWHGCPSEVLPQHQGPQQILVFLL